MDKLTWFKFSPSDYMMGKIQRCPEITQARFLRLCCLYWNKEGSLSIDDAIIDIEKEHFDILTAKKVLKFESDYVMIDFLDEQLDEIGKVRKQASDAGKASAEIRRQKRNDRLTTVKPPSNGIQQSREEKKREEERREEIIFPFLKNVLVDWQNDLDFQEIYQRFIREVHGNKWSEAKHISLIRRLKGSTKALSISSIDSCIINGWKEPKPEWIKKSDIVDDNELKPPEGLQVIHGNLNGTWVDQHGKVHDKQKLTL